MLLCPGCLPMCSQVLQAAVGDGLELCMAFSRLLSRRTPLLADDWATIRADFTRNQNLLLTLLARKVAFSLSCIVADCGVAEHIGLLFATGLAVGSLGFQSLLDASSASRPRSTVTRQVNGPRRPRARKAAATGAAARRQTDINTSASTLASSVEQSRRPWRHSASARPR